MSIIGFCIFSWAECNVARLWFDEGREGSGYRYQTGIETERKICAYACLENADYGGHSVSMLQRVAAALHKKITNFVHLDLGKPAIRMNTRSASHRTCQLCR
jgi:hypothetical protein